jgi:CubicO group peptidase (beta-lactamase class C family)
MTPSETLASFIEEHREAWEVPGCAVAVLKDDEVVLNEGFGLRNVEDGLQVTPTTLFAIGSSTKAFTAAAVGAMVDDGQIEWDTPLRDYIPGFRLHDPVATDRIAPRDLLSHRTGLPRHEFAWMAHPERSRADLVSRLRHLPLSKDIRQDFQYCNFGYMTAGYLVEVVTGMPWEEYVSTRLLKPLSMDETNFSVGVSQRSEDYSKPYERREGSVVEIPFRVIDQAGPAGSINSTTTDMLAWVRTNLALGESQDQVIAHDTLRKMQSPQMVFPEDLTFPETRHYAYGLGWLIGEYRGHRLVEHGGGIDGFLTELMLLPQEKIGLVVLTNSTTSVLGRTIAYRVLDELLELEPLPWHERFKERYDAMQTGMKEARSAGTRVDAPLPRELDAYAGEYEHPGYGTFSVAVEDDRLVPSFGTLNISLSHRHFDVFDLEWRELSEDVHVFPLTFETGPEGDVTGLTVPFEPTIDSIRFLRKADARARDPEVLRTLAGTYEMGPIELVVALKAESTLTAATGGGPTVELVPDRGLRFRLKESASTTVEFVLGEDGSVEKVIVQPAGIFTPKQT